MGTLYIVATPIGNLEDISIRAIRTLFSVDVIACEDTRRAGILLQELRTRYEPLIQQFSDTLKEPVFMRYDDHTEHQAAPEILELLREDKSVALISDAGTPLINDPGFILVREARRKQIPIISIPGASAVLTALTSSGLPADKFTFLGYPPEKQGHRLKLFQSVVDTKLDVTYVFYVAPHKLSSALSDLQHVIGNRDITLSRELTKVHEEVWTGSISAALSAFQDPKGEFVLLIHLAV